MTDLGRVTVAGTGLTISRIGFGAARLAGGSELRASRALVEQALKCGISHFDTAPTYGDGASEAVLGEVLAGVKGVTITTKVGFERPTTTPQASPARLLYRKIAKPLLTHLPALKARLQRPEPPRAFIGDIPLHRDFVLKSLDQSERLLRRPADILLLHEPGRYMVDDELLHLFEELMASGRIMAYGTGTGEPEPPVALGQVVQARWQAGAPAPSIGQLAIWHGVLRGSRSVKEAAMRMASAMNYQPQAAFLVSASSPHQLRSLIPGT